MIFQVFKITNTSSKPTSSKSGKKTLSTPYNWGVDSVLNFTFQLYQIPIIRLSRLYRVNQHETIGLEILVQIIGNPTHICMIRQPLPTTHHHPQSIVTLYFPRHDQEIIPIIKGRKFCLDRPFFIHLLQVHHRVF